MTRSFSFFEGAGAGADGAHLGSSGCRTGGGATTTGAGTGGRGPGHVQPAAQTTAMSKHIREIIVFFMVNNLRLEVVSQTTQDHELVQL